MKEDIGAIIVAAGFGSLREIDGNPFPKLLEEVGSRSIIVRVVQAVVEAGLSRIVVVLNPLFEEAIRNHLRRTGWSSGIQYVIQPARLGAADAVERALPILQMEHTLVTFADMPLWGVSTIQAVIETYRQATGVGAMVTVPITSRSPPILGRYGRVIGSGTRIQRVVEPAEATEEERAIKLVNPNLGAWNALWLRRKIPHIHPAPKNDGYAPEKHFPPLVHMAAQQGKWVNEYRLSNPIEALGVNTSEELSLVNELYLPT